MFGWGRCGRREYWILIGILMAGMFGIAVFFPEAANVNRVLGMVWIIIWIMRLHDIGKSGWWALPPVLLSAIPMIAAIWILGSDFIKAFSTDDLNSIDPSGQTALYLILVVALTFLIQLAFTIYLGLKPSDPAANKFGSSKTLEGSENASLQ